MTRNYDPTVDTRPPTTDQPINLADLKDILGKAIKHPEVRKALAADPEKALRDMNYAPHPAAVDFFKSLATTDFEKAAETFKGAHNDPSIGMAEA
jgi:hypothetical protein